MTITKDGFSAEAKRLAAKYPKARDWFVGPAHSMFDYLLASPETRAKWDAELAEARRQAEAFNAELAEWGRSQR